MRTWLVGALGMAAGLFLGGGGAYVWMRPGADGPGGRPSQAPAPPTEAEGNRLLRKLLSEVSAGSEVENFRSTGWERFEGVAEHTADHPCFEMTYTAEVKFGAPCHIKENFTFMWGHHADKGKASLSPGKVETRRFASGDRLRVKGLLGWYWRDGVWQPIPRGKNVAGTTIDTLR